MKLLVLQTLFAFVHGLGTDDTLSKALLEDLLPDSTSSCVGSDSTTSFTFDYSENQENKWDESAKDLEKTLFLAEISHTDTESHRSWSLRVGQGSNIYSFVGAYGESVPPQYHKNGEYVDEVWQSVAVSDLNDPAAGEPYFIHQAGTYSKGNRTTPFFSPNVAKHCEGSSCYMASWGQHAHLPTNFTSSAIYFNSYRNCGGGVIEVTTAIHNNALPGGDKFVYNNVPWGGVRTSVLQDVVIGNAQSNGNQQDPLKGFGDNSFIPNLDETGGYTAFAEDLPSIEGFKMPCADEATGQAADCEAMSAKPVSLSLPGKRFTMPRGVELKTPAAPDVIPCGDGSGKIAPCTQSNTSKVNLKIVSICRESPRHTKKWGKFTVRCKIEPTALVNVGCHRGCSFRFTNPSTGSSITATDKAVLHWAWKGKFFFFWPDATEGEVQQVFPPGSDIQATYLHEPLPCVESPGHTKAWGRYTVRCQIEPTTVNTDPDFSSIVLKNPDTSGTVEASKGILHYSHAQKNFYLWPDVSAEAVSKVFPWGSSIVPSYEDSVDRCRESPGHTLNLGVYTVVCTIEPTAILKTGYYGNLVMTNPDTGSKIPLKGVLHWAWNGNSFYFYPDATAGEVNEAFPSGSKFEFEKSGKPVEENLALALVHGTHGKSDFDRAKPRIRFGGASGIRRDYTVFTVNAISNIMPGDTYVQKQFFISDKFTEIDARARSLSPQTTRDLYTRATTPQGRDVLLYTVPGQTDVFSASIGSLSCASATTVCRGSTTPKQEYRAYFAIECGEERYVGSDPYYFAPKSTPIQSWKCESNELTPTWKLLGYFPPGECDEISNLTYRLNLC